MVLTVRTDNVAFMDCFDMAEAKELVARSLRLAGRANLSPGEEKALRLFAHGMKIGWVAATLASSQRYTRAALLAARDKILSADRRFHGETLGTFPNRVVVEPMRGVVPDADHPDPADPEHFLPIRMAGGAEDDKIRLHPSLVSVDDLAGDTERAWAIVTA